MLRASQNPNVLIPLKSILILFSHLRLGLPKGLFPSGFPNNTLYAFQDISVCATCPAHLSRLDLKFLIMIGDFVKFTDLIFMIYEFDE